MRAVFTAPLDLCPLCATRIIKNVSRSQLRQNPMADVYNLSDVFISYSRRDKAFVTRLVERLQATGLSLWVDWEDIPPTVDWWREIQAGIEGASTFIFIISPDAVTSTVCRQELDHGVESSKRFIPVLFREVIEPEHKEKMHPVIGQHNWIFMRDTDDFEAAFQTLHTALSTDFEYVRMHTRLLVRAREWEAKWRDSSYLLRGTDVREADAWLALSASHDPDPTPLQMEYVQASKEAERRRQRNLLLSSMAALIVTLVLAVAALFQWQRAEENFVSAEQNRLLAEGNLATAEVRGTQVAQQRNISLNNLRVALDTQSLFLANLSDQELTNGNSQTALLLARASLAHVGEGIYNVQSYEALVNAINSPTRESAILEAGGARLLPVGWNADETRILTERSPGAAYLWDREGQQVAALLHDDLPTTPVRARWSANSERILTWAGSEVVLWNASGAEIRRLIFVRETVDDARISPDHTLLSIQTRSAAATFFYGFSVETGEQTYRIELPGSPPLQSAWNRDWTRLLVVSSDVTRLFDATGALLGEFPDILSVSWSADGSAWLANPAALYSAEGVEVARHPEADANQPPTWNARGDLALAWTPQRVLVWQPSGLLSLERSGLNISRIDWMPGDGDRLIVVQQVNPNCLSFDTCSYNLQIWTSDGQVLTSTRFESASGDIVQVNAVATRLLVGTCSEVTLYDLALNQEIAEIILPETPDLSCGGVWNGLGDRFFTRFGNTLVLWNADGQPIASLSHPYSTRSAFWSEDGTYLLVPSGSGRVRVYDRDGRSVLEFDYDSSPESLLWTRTRDALVVGLGTRLHLWRLGDAAANRLDLTAWDGIAWNSDESRFATWLGGDLTVWDAAGVPLQRLTQEGSIATVRFSADSGRLLVTSNPPRDCRDCPALIIVWDTVPGTPLLRIENRNRLAYAEWNASETRIFAQTERRANCIGLCRVDGLIFDQDGVRLNEAPLVHTGTSDMLVAANRFFITNQRRQESAIFNADALRVASITAPGDVRTLLIAPEDRFYVTFTQSSVSTIQIWEPEPGAAWRLIAELSDPGGRALAAQALLSPDANHLLTIANAPLRCGDACASALLLWNTNDWQAAPLVLEHSGRIQGAAWTQDGHQILSWGDDGVRFWSRVGDPLRALLPGPIDEAAWNSSESAVLARGRDGSLFVWGMADEPIFSGRIDGLQGVRWSPDGLRFAAWARDKRVFIFSITGDATTIVAQPDLIRDVFWHPDAARLLVQTIDHALLLWRIQDGKLLARMPHPEQPRTVQFSADASRLIVESAQAGRRWLLDVGAILTLPDAQPVRDFTTAETRRFFLAQELIDPRALATRD